MSFILLRLPACAMLALLAVVFGLLLTPSTAQAQLLCTPSNLPNNNDSLHADPNVPRCSGLAGTAGLRNLQIQRNDDGSGICQNGNGMCIVENTSNDGFNADFGPADTRSCANPTAGLTVITETFLAFGNTIGRIVLAGADGTCNARWTWSDGGTTFTMTALLTRGGGGTTITATNVTVSGGAFGPSGPTAQDKSNTVAALQNMFDSATPGLLDNLPINGGGGGNGTGVTIAPTGLGFSSSHLDSANPMDRDYGFLSAPKGYFDGGQKVRRGNGFNFSVDLNALARGAANDNASHSSSSPDLIRGSMLMSSKRLGQPGGTMDYRVKPGNDEGERLGYGTTSSKDGAPRPQSRVTSFIKGEYVDFDDGETNADRDGHLWVVTSGLGLRVSPDTTIGLLSRYRTGEADSNALAATLDSDFWGGGAFLTTTIGDGLKVALAGLYESGDNDIRIGTATGSFDSEHVTLEGRLSKRLERGTWWFEPGVGIRYVDTEQDNYTDSAGTLVVNRDLTLGRLTYGPKIGTTLHRGNATVKPYARIGGVWDFENESNFATTTAGTYTSADHGLNLGGGVEVTYLSGLSLRLSGDWFTYDTDLEVWSISGGIGTPLSALGLGQVGFVSLDLSASAEDASARARLSIPLGASE